MRVCLAFRDRNLDAEAAPPPDTATVVQDLGLDDVFAAMSEGDAFLESAARQIVVAGLTDPGDIAYRQEILRDCLAHPDAVRALYDIALEASGVERTVFAGVLSRRPSAILDRSVQVLELLVARLRRLREIAEEHAGEFRSDGLTAFCDRLTTELQDGYFATVERHLGQLRFSGGMVISATLGPGGRGTDYLLHAPQDRKQGVVGRFLTTSRPTHVIRLPDSDEAGERAMAELRDRAVNNLAGALSATTDHVLGFFSALRRELAFYLGGVNLHARLTERGTPMCFPTPVPAGEPAFAAEGLHDAGLALRTEAPLVANDVAADGRGLVMVTGANQGGKSTFLRGVGLAQVMMQCGLFVTAASLRANVASGLFTHFRREEDPDMERGKLAEDLDRMSAIADHLKPGAVVLLNESFAATNEREGSEIAHEIVRALLDAGVRVFYVTHLFDVAQRLHDQVGRSLFLRAERLDDGSRTFRMVEGAPQPTSHGQDIYDRVMGGRVTATAPPER